MKIALAQINPLVGDLVGNAQLILEACKQAQEGQVSLLVFPEMALWGYPAQDLLFEPELLAKADELMSEALAPQVKNAVIVGSTYRDCNDRLFNAAYCLQAGRIEKIVCKSCLPNYEIFNESRYFKAASSNQDRLWAVNGQKIGVFICEDLLGAETDFHQYDQNPLAELLAAGQQPDALVCLAASPYRRGQQAIRANILQEASRQAGAVPVLFANQVGANDQLIFDGHSGVYKPQGCCVSAPSFQEALLLVDLDASVSSTSIKAETQEVLEALVLGIKDYFRKAGFQRAILGVSGGIDSAVVASLAVRALGSENVLGVMIPSAYTSSESELYFERLVLALGIESKTISLEGMLAAWHTSTGMQTLTLAEENAQSRLRGLVLMSLANDQNALVLACGNKSEFSLGYSTLYGDMCGAIAPIGDLLKTEVYELARLLPEIPQEIIARAPSAELRPDQLDTDSLPPYAELDRDLGDYFTQRKALPAKLAQTFARSEFKRQQAPIILKVSKNAFGKGWQQPILRGKLDNLSPSAKSPEASDESNL